jgi:hypothetical protein
MTESMPWQPKRSKMHVCTCKFVVSFRTAKMCLLPWLHRRFGSTMHDPFSDWDLKSHPRRESPFLPLNHITQFPTSVFQYVCFKEKRALEIANELVGTKKDRLSLESAFVFSPPFTRSAACRKAAASRTAQESGDAHHWDGGGERGWITEAQVRVNKRGGGTAVGTWGVTFESASPKPQPSAHGF